VTVVLAHLAFGLTLGFLSPCFLGGQLSTLSNSSAVACPGCLGFDGAKATARQA
jgi:hypothetical protein